MKVGELCTRDVAIATENESIANAAARMLAMQVGSLVVVDGPERARVPVGILTDRDMLGAIVGSDAGHTRDQPVHRIMARKIVTIAEESEIYEAMQSMRTHHVRRLPVVDAAGHLVGIVTFDDMILWMGEQLSNLTGLVGKQLPHKL